MTAQPRYFGPHYIYSTYCAFAAVKTNGKVVVWGDPATGGDPGAVAAELSEGVQRIYSIF